MESGSVDMLGPFFQKSSRENKKKLEGEKKIFTGYKRREGLGCPHIHTSGFSTIERTKRVDTPYPHLSTPIHKVSTPRTVLYW
jgi:hypothetical protein